MIIKAGHKLEYYRKLSEELFDPVNLADVSDDSIWKPYCEAMVD